MPFDGNGLGLGNRMNFASIFKKIYVNHFICADWRQFFQGSSSRDFHAFFSCSFVRNEWRFVLAWLGLNLANICQFQSISHGYVLQAIRII